MCLLLDNVCAKKKNFTFEYINTAININSWNNFQQVQQEKTNLINILQKFSFILNTIQYF